MALDRIVILDEESEHELGNSIRAITHPGITGEVLLAESRDQVARMLGESRGLIMPILPRSMPAAVELLSRLRSDAPSAALLPVFRHDSVAELLEAVTSSSEDFLVTPLRPPEVQARVRKMIQPGERLPGDEAAERLTKAFGLAQLIGEDAAFNTLKERIALAAQFESTVYLYGETGTGKERCARALHYLSRRADKPFIPINCGAVPSDLFESELYGHRKGAFTGAVSTHPGLIAEAEGGTLFLDEVETLSLASQVKLLRFLQEKTYHSLGCAKAKQADVWIVASSNVDLLEKAREGTFREDLFYRLAVITLALPALRQRKGDIPLLAEYFLKVHGQKHGKHKRRFSAEAAQALCEYSWPGNVRELENVIQQVTVFSDSPVISSDELPIPQSSAKKIANGCFKESKARTIDEFEKAYVTDLLRTHNGNVTHAALAAKMDRRAFGRLIKKHKIEKHC